MTYGLRTKGAAGVVELDQNSFTVRIIHSEIVQSSGQSVRSRYIAIPGVDPSTHSAVCVPIAAYDTGAQMLSAIQYTPILSAGGVTIHYGAVDTSTGPLGEAPQRLIVTRYR